LGNRETAPTYQTAPVNTGTLQVTVSATGPITNPTSVPVSFKSTGRLSEVDVAVGDHVTAGQVLAKQDTSDLQAAVDQAQATLAQQQANEATTSAGPSDQTIAQAQAQVDAAQATLDGAQKSLGATQASVNAGNASAQADVDSAQATLG